MPKKIVITGGPGSGKTSLIDFLEENGYQCQHEISRQVTLEAKKKGIDQLFLSDPILFSQLLLKGRLQQHQEVDHFKKTILFYDRGLPDVTAYMDFTNVSYPESFHTTCNKYRYGTVFILPPWKDIYIQDNERYETYEEAEKIHKFLTQSYQKYGYEVIEVPFGTLEERMKFMITHLEI
jgi:predicted ATPase